MSNNVPPRLPHYKSGTNMRTEEARPVRLADYRPPDWLVETVELDVSLDPDGDAGARHARAQAGSNGAPRRRRSCSTAMGSCSSRSRSTASRCRPEQYVATADRLTIAQPPPRPFRLEIETVDRPVRQHRSSWASIARAAFTAPNARPRAFAASPISPTVPT